MLVAMANNSFVVLTQGWVLLSIMHMKLHFQESVFFMGKPDLSFASVHFLILSDGKQRMLIRNFLCLYSFAFLLSLKPLWFQTQTKC